MVVLVALSSALAVMQDAHSLAVLATLAGFLAPVLISRGGGHVALFRTTLPSMSAFWRSHGSSNGGC